MWCGTIQSSRPTSVYKRLTPGLVNPYDLFTNNWYSQKLKEKNNNLNKDFEIYDTESDLRSSKGRWTFCNYDDPGIGYPRDCGKNGHVGIRGSALNVPRKMICQRLRSIPEMTVLDTRLLLPRMIFLRVIFTLTFLVTVSVYVTQQFSKFVSRTCGYASCMVQKQSENYRYDHLLRWNCDITENLYGQIAFRQCEI